MARALYEFGDYQCPNCLSWWISVEPQIKEKLVKTGKARFIFVEFAFLGRDSFSAAQAAKCAGDQGRYWEYHDTLYSEQRGIDTGWASVEKLKKFASDLGLDKQAFNTCLDGGKYGEIVKSRARVFQTISSPKQSKNLLRAASIHPLSRISSRSRVSC